MTLAEYDSTGRLQAAPDAARARDRVDGEAAVWFEETTAGRSRVYWDVEGPRPVSATVVREQPIADLLAFYDTRGFTAVTRAELPGPQFRSPLLWDLARSLVERSRGDCAAIARDQAYEDAAEQVDCTFAGGVRVEFALARDRAALQRFRSVVAAPEGARPGSLRVGGWRRPETTEPGQLIEYARADGSPVLYFDDPAVLGLGRLFGAGMTQDQLEEFFATDGTG